MKFVPVPLLLIVLLSIGASGQSLYFRNYQVNNGLSSNTVTCIIQDKKGFIWLGSRNGLNRFDGSSFKVFGSRGDDSTTLGSNSVLSLCEDQQEQLWVGTYNGVFIYNPVTEHFRAFSKFPLAEVRYLAEDRQKNIWAVVNFSLYRFNPETGELVHYDTENNVVALRMSESGVLWIASSSGTVKKYLPASDTFRSYQPVAAAGQSLSAIQDIYPVNDSTLFLGTMTELVRYHTNTLQLTRIFQESVHGERIQIHKILRQSDDEYWLGTENGLYLIDLKKNKQTAIRKQYGNAYSITDNVIYAFCKDREGGTWIGTFFGGVNYFAPQLNNFQKYLPQTGPRGLTGNLVHEICEDHTGNIWIGTEDAGLNKLNDKTGHITQYLPGKEKTKIAYQNIHGLLAVDNELWIGTYEHGLDVMDINTGKVVRHYKGGSDPHALNGNFIVSLYKTGKGEILIGTWNGLSRYNRKDDSFIRDSFFTMQIQTMHEDADGTLWIGSYGNGVYFENKKAGIRGNLRHIPGDKTSLSNNYINNIFEDSHGDLWFSTESGLQQFPKRNKLVAHAFGPVRFADRQVFRVLEDDHGSLWVSTSKGLIQYQSGETQYKTYSTEDGLTSEQFNYNSGLRSSTGKIYFGTVEGMIGFTPAAFSRSNYVAPAYLTGLQINNKTYSSSPSLLYSSHIRLPYDSSTISLEMAALSYITPQKNQYAYLMEGFDKEWTELQQKKTISYTKLPPGDYVFRIKAAGNSGIWNPREKSLRFTILAPWWQSPFAYVCYALLVAAILIVIARYYHLALSEKNQRQLQAMAIRKEREVYNAKIEFFTNIAHEIRTPLTLIKLPLDKMGDMLKDNLLFTESLSMMKKNTNRLIDLTDQLLDFRKVESNKLTLNFVMTDISELLKELFFLFKPVAEQKKLALSLSVPRVAMLSAVDAEAVKKILGNMINNAIKYADKTVLIRLLAFSSDDRIFHIEISNDGHLIPIELREKIFEPFFRISETDKQPGTGIGLPLARSLAELHRGTLVLKEPDGYMNVFRLSIPVRQENEMDLGGYEVLESGDAAPAEEAVAQADGMQVLLVEDNREILHFIQKELRSNYRIYLAQNGGEALDILSAENIQLVITDIMMPVMDGIELCRRMKADIRYSHVPVILLTAKNSLNSKIEGLEVGADAYLEKPFSMEHLQAQVSNLLANRQIVRDYFAKSPLLHLKSIAVSPTDRTFIEELQRLINDNITDMDLDVDKLSRMMNMSRTNFYRKIKALSDLSPNELINMTRLKKAAELLAEGKYKISEVAHIVGYSLNSNFSRDFHRQFGMSPSAYVAGLKKE